MEMKGRGEIPGLSVLCGGLEAVEAESAEMVVDFAFFYPVFPQYTMAALYF